MGSGVLVHQPSGAAFLLCAGVQVRRRWRRRGGHLGFLLFSGKDAQCDSAPGMPEALAHLPGQLSAPAVAAQLTLCWHLTMAQGLGAGHGASLLPRDSDLSASCLMQCCFPASLLVTGVWGHVIALRFASAYPFCHLYLSCCL